jgi:hypothetical protein
MDCGVTDMWGAKAKSIGVTGFLPGDDRLGLPEMSVMRGCVQHVEVEFPWF